jgi:hypothetical protein
MDTWCQHTIVTELDFANIQYATVKVGKEVLPNRGLNTDDAGVEKLTETSMIAPRPRSDT